MQVAKAIVGLILFSTSIVFFLYRRKIEKLSRKLTFLDLRAKQMAKTSQVESFSVKELKKVEYKAHEIRDIKLVDAKKYYQTSTLILVVLGATLGLLEILDLIF